MKTLINKNGMRLAGGLAVLLMTVIMAVATAKSYAWEWYGGPCSHLRNYLGGVGCDLQGGLTCAQCCWLQCPWCQETAGDQCVSGPDKNGYGFQYCNVYSGTTTIECGVTTWYGSCDGSSVPYTSPGVWSYPGGPPTYVSGCVNVCRYDTTYPPVTITTGTSVVSGGLTCYPEN